MPGLKKTGNHKIDVIVGDSLVEEVGFIPADDFKSKIAEAKNSEQIAGLSDEQRDKAFDLLEIMVAQAERCHTPVLGSDCTIEMGLMKGGVLKICEPNGHHVMQGKRQMKLLSEKGDSDEMLSTYIMAACSTIDDKPAAMHDIHERLTARDFTIALGFFCRINLL
jgi:hypothetical protein